jgi:chromate reductase, NAD(P)H dehydrogenase (quinone)
MRILAIAGSVARNSSNSRLLHDMAAATDSVDVQVWESLDRLPYFRPDADGDPEVTQLRQAVAAADAVWIATPEYAGGMPGALKNALDWLVGSGELYGKRMVVLSAAPSEQRGGNARRWVEEVARMQGAKVLESFTVALTATATDMLVGVVAGQALARAVRALTESDGAGSEGAIG